MKKEEVEKIEKIIKNVAIDNQAYSWHNRVSKMAQAIASQITIDEGKTLDICREHLNSKILWCNSCQKMHSFLEHYGTHNLTIDLAQALKKANPIKIEEVKK